MSQDLPGMLAVAKGVAEQKWPHTMDAAVWTKEFLSLYKGLPVGGANVDESALIGWFANAIMAGYDTAQSRVSSSADSQPATAPNSDLLRELASRFAPGCIRPCDTLHMEPFTHAELTAIQAALLVACAPPKDGDSNSQKILREQMEALRFAAKHFEQYGFSHLAMGHSWTGAGLAEALQMIEGRFSAIRRKDAP